MKSLISIISVTLILSFLMFTFVPVSSGDLHCKILPDNAEDRNTYCSTCGQATDYCPKNDCACADSKCFGWIQNEVCDWSQSITVCGGVCNDRRTEEQQGTMYHCVNPEKYISSMISKGFTFTNFNPLETPNCTFCGIAPAGGTCTNDGECATRSCMNGKCAYSYMGRPCLTNADCSGTNVACYNSTCEICNSDKTLRLDNKCHKECGASTKCDSLSPGTGCCSGCYSTDVNNDGKVDIKDVLIVAKKYGAITPSGAFSYMISSQYTHLGLIANTVVILVALIAIIVIIFVGFKFFARKK